MADPTIVLLVVVGLTAGERPRGSVVSSAVEAALGASARVLVEERTSTPLDADATSTATRLGIGAIAEIAWADQSRSHAHLHVYLASDLSWYDQDLSFEVTDALEDRERSAGLLVGAMIRARQTEEHAAAAPAPAASPPTASGATAPNATASGALAPPPSVTDDAAISAPDVATLRRLRFAIDVGGFGMAGVGGEAPGLGPAMRARVLLDRSASLHAGVAVGFASLPAAAATMTTTRLALGGRWRFPSLLRSDAVVLGLGLEAVAVRHAVTRAAPEASRDRWLAGGHLDGGVDWSLGRAFELYGTVGSDVVLGATPITLAGQKVAEIPHVRATAEIGARITF
jgi:opacity protein-like surface antigen